jgi:pyruvate-ferredoxin/flavodoxin oxidoreductase
MLFRKFKAREERFRFPGKKHALDGHGAVYTVETMACEAVLVRAVPDLAEITGPVRRLAPAGYEPVSDQPVVVRHVGEVRPLVGQLAGYAEAGLRAAGITTSIDSATDSLTTASGQHLTYVINLTCRAPQRHSGPIRGSHDEYHRAADTGCFLMFAKNAQETADLTLIAHRIAELSLTPGICAQDYYRTTHSVQTVRLPDRGLAAVYLGRPEDTIPSPTPAQRFLFGEERRRIPIFVDRDRPAGIGGTGDEESHYRGVAAQRPFFTGHVDGLIDDAMSEFAKLTGRVYGKLTAYRVDDADFVVIAQGAVVEELEAVVDHVREKDKIKAGVIAVRVFRPFPGAELTRLLKGKTAVTVLERTDQPLAEDPPMAKEIRSALSKAAENGAATGDDVPYPAYERYARPADRPRLHSGAFGVGGRIPLFADLRAVFRNMTSAGARKKFFYLGAVFAAPDRRFPHLESLHQRLEKEYPRLDDLSLVGAADDGPEAGHVAAFQLYSLSVQGGLFAGNLFAQTLAGALERTVRTYPDGGLEASIQPVNFTFCHTTQDEPITSKPLVMDAILVSGDRLLENLPARARIKKGGVLVVETNRSPADLWRCFSRRTAGWITGAEPVMFTVDARKIAAETSARSTFVDQLAVWALFGAYVKTANLFGADELARYLAHLAERLARLFDPADYLAEDVKRCFVRGMEETSPFDWKRFASEKTAGAPEPEAPWTVQQVKEHDRTVFDVNRFWHSVGYLYDRGEPDKTLTDPYLATGIVPAGSSAFRDMTPYRLRIPRWSPSKCQACGLCWSICPDSALPSAVSTIPAILEAAVRKCQDEGHSFVHFPRIADHLAKHAYAVFSKEGDAKSETLGPFLKDGFQKISEKLADGDKRRLLEEEFALVHAAVEHYPVARTERFFDEPHKNEKGSGKLLSIAHNPASCTGCGLCVEVCPNDAHEWTEQTAELLDRKRKIWEFQMKLPDPAAAEIDSFISPAEPQTEVYRLLDKTAYHSMVGGDAAFPGNAVKTAVHLVTAAAESVMRPRHRAHVDKLDRLIAQLEERIQGKVARTLEINDFERFGGRLNRLRREGVTAEALAKIIEEEGGGSPIDPDQLARLTGLLSRIKEQRASYAGAENGVGRARMAIAIDPGTATFWSGAYPYNPLRQPWVSHLAGDAPALAEGIYEGVTRHAVEEIRNCRQAELEAADSYDPRRHDDFFEKFGASDLTEEEWALVPPRTWTRLPAFSRRAGLFAWSLSTPRASRSPRMRETCRHSSVRLRTAAWIISRGCFFRAAMPSCFRPRSATPGICSGA